MKLTLDESEGGSTSKEQISKLFRFNFEMFIRDPTPDVYKGVFEVNFLT